MTFNTGARIGPYEITGPLGEGGMGIVFRARDARLERDVAVKMLPDAFASDPDRLARFRREAQVLASLNHPGIAHVYGLEESGGSRCIVMELVEGETLAARLRRGPLPPEEALHAARQIIDAVEAAHEKGIVHRDLKPGNIMVLPDGKVKVLDFGLATAYEVEAGNGDFSNSPTLMSMAASNAGVILGTAAYMSPEQAKGKRVDQRTDIFAFGCVLFEMLTGRPAFEGEDLTEILGRVLTAEPDWRRLPARTPVAIQRLLQRALKKDPRQRLADIRDARLEIEEALSKDPSARISAGVPSRRLIWTLAAAAGLIIAALSIPAIVHLREQPTDAPEMRVEINTPATQQPLHFAISPDGSRLVFVALGDGAQRLWIRPLDSAAFQPLEGTEGAEFPFWSADSRSVGFFASGKLYRIDIGGGAPRILADASTGRGGAWNGDGTILFAPSNTGPLFRIAATGGPPAPATKLDPQQGGHRHPQFLPDGKQFLFFAQGGTEGQGIYLASLDGGEARLLIATDSSGAYMEPSLILFNRQGTLVARALDVAGGVLTGEEIAIAERVGSDIGFNLSGFSVSAAGSIAYRTSGSERRQLTWIDRGGKITGVIGEADSNSLLQPELSLDDRRVAVGRIVQNNEDVWLIDVLRGGYSRFTFDAARDVHSVWSRDGMRVAFTSNRKGSFDLFSKELTGGGEVLLLESTHTKSPLDWSPDGNYLLYTDTDPTTGWDLWALPFNGDQKPVAVAATPFDELFGQFSLDGRWVAYQSNESGRNEIFLQPFPGPGGKSQVSTAGGRFPRWRRDGNELFFIAPDGKLMAAPIQTFGPTLETGSPVALFQMRTPVGGAAELKAQYAVSRDGRFLVNMPVEGADAVPITLLLNWTPPAN